jgi:hydrogenase maturation protease
MSDSSHPAPVLILGIGNILLGDEGIGVRVIEAMRSQSLPQGVEVIDGGTGGADLIEVIAHRRKAIVVDAMDADCEPGTLMRLSPDDLVPRGDTRISLHDVGLLDALHMAGHLGCAPAQIVIIGIQPKSVAWGTELSAELAACVPKIIERVMAELGVA